MSRRGDAGPGSRLFSNDYCAGRLGGQQRVELLQEGAGFKILSSPMNVRLPLTWLAAVVEVEHGRHSIDPQSVHVVAACPLQGAGQQKIAHLVAPEVVDQRVPVRVKSLAGVLMLVQCRAAEAHEAGFVRGEA